MNPGALRFRIVDDGDSAAWEELTFPAYRGLRSGSSEAILRVGVSLIERPAALGIARIPAGTGAGQILSIAVAASWRKQGIGTAILAYLEQELRSIGCRWAEMVFADSSPSVAAIRRMLENRGWRAPWPRMAVAHSTIDAMIQEAWIGKAIAKTLLPAPLEVLPWRDLDAVRKQSILERQRAYPWYPEALSPFHEERLIEPGNSLAVLLHGEVVGWMITHRIAEDTIRYGSLFLREDVRTRSSAMALPARAIQLHHEFLAHAPKATCNCEVGNGPMMRFFRRRLAPCSSTYTTFASCLFFE